MYTLPFGKEQKYDVHIGKEILGDVGVLLQSHFSSCRVALFCDENVAPLYGKTVERSLLAQGFSVMPFVLPAGEKHKTFDSYISMINHLIAHQFTRGDVVLSLGGGVMNDMSGFVASTYMRGIPFISLPTTLLCAVDACIGGKTAIDLPQGKNLIGAFHSPSLVVVDTALFATLSKAQFAQGMAECIKHALIADRSLLDDLQNEENMEGLPRLVKKNMEIKHQFVLQDAKDKGIRQMLNFGHTLGHALEKASDFALSHGEAVAIGMVMETRAARKMGFSSVDENEISDILQKFNLPFSWNGDKEAFIASTLRDKKWQGDQITLAYLTAFGKGELRTISKEAFAQFIECSFKEGE